MAKQEIGRVAAETAAGSLKQAELAHMLKKKIAATEDSNAANAAELPAPESVFASVEAPIQLAQAGTGSAAGAGMTGGGFSLASALTLGAAAVGAGFLIVELNDDGDDDGGTDVPVAPTTPRVVSVTGSSDGVNEGGTVTFTIATADIPDGGTLNYRVTGISPADVDKPLEGVLQINDDVATITFNVTADQTAEGSEVMTLTVSGGKLDQVTIADTSVPATGSVQTVLHVGQDNIIGGSASESFTAPVFVNAEDNGDQKNTLESIDAVRGGAGNDTLTASLLGGSNVAPLLSGVENVTVTFLGTTASTLDLQNSSGVLRLTNSGSSANSTFANVGDARVLAVEDTNANTTFSGSTAGTDALHQLTLIADTVGDPSASATPVNISLSGSLATAANMVLTDSNVNYLISNLADLSVTANGVNFLSLDASAHLATVTVTGSGILVLGLPSEPVGSFDFQLLDASANTGGVAAYVVSALSVEVLGSSAQDVLAFAGPGMDITGGGGNDVIAVQGNNNKTDSLIYTAAGDARIADANSDSKVDAVETIVGFLATTSDVNHDVLDLSAFEFASGLRVVLSKGSLAAPVEGGALPNTNGFFTDGSGDHAVAFAVNGSNTYVFVDVDGNHNLTAADMVIKLSGVTDFGQADVLFV